MYCGTEIDIWSSGVILYALLTGMLPFDDPNIYALFAKIRSGKYFEPIHLSSEARDLLKRMICVDPLKRITISEIKQHIWFRQDIPLYLKMLWKNLNLNIKSDFDENVMREININFPELGIMSPKDYAEILKPSTSSQFQVFYNIIDHRKQTAWMKEQMDKKNVNKIFSKSQITLAKLNQLDLLKAVSCMEKPPELLFKSQDEELNKFALHWKYGIVFNSSPYECLNNILNILKNEGICWKFIELPKYKIICLKENHDDKAKSIAFNMIIYSMPSVIGGYLLNFIKKRGIHIEFLELLKKIISQILLGMGH